MDLGDQNQQPQPKEIQVEDENNIKFQNQSEINTGNFTQTFGSQQNFDGENKGNFKSSTLW